MKPTQNVVLAVIAGIVILESIALFKGIDGLLFTSVIAALALLGGKVLPQTKL